MKVAALKKPEAKKETKTNLLAGTKNVHAEITDGKLILTVDLAKNFGKSASGKSTIIASTLGNKFLEAAGVSIGVNVYK